MCSHYYEIFSKKHPQRLFRNGNTSCFAEFTSSYSNSPALSFDKDKYMLVYLPYFEIKRTTGDQLACDWINYLKYIGLPFTVERKQEKIIDYLSYTDYLVVKVDFSKYINKAHVKIALHIMRYCFETQDGNIIKRLFELKNLNKKASLFELWQYSCFHTNSYIGHPIFYRRRFYKPMKIKEFKAFIKGLEGKEYTNNEMNEFEKLVYKTELPVPQGFNFDNYFEYIKLFKDVNR